MEENSIKDTIKLLYVDNNPDGILFYIYFNMTMG
jgi:hypothetical protein